MKSLIEREIEVDQVGAAQYSAFGIPEHAGRRLTGSESRNSKCSLVEPAIESLMARIAAAQCCLLRHIKGEVVRVVNPVRASTECAGIGNVASEEGIKGLATMHRGYTANLPIT